MKPWLSLFRLAFIRFLGSIGATVDELYDEIRKDSSQDFYSGSTLVAVINASVEFKNFHAMMVIYPSIQRSVNSQRSHQCLPYLFISSKLKCDARPGEFIWGLPPLQDAKTGELFCDR